MTDIPEVFDCLKQNRDYITPMLMVVTFKKKGTGKMMITLRSAQCLPFCKMYASTCAPYSSLCVWMESLQTAATQRHYRSDSTNSTCISHKKLIHYLLSVQFVKHLWSCLLLSVFACFFFWLHSSRFYTIVLLTLTRIYFF